MGPELAGCFDASAWPEAPAADTKSNEQQRGTADERRSRVRQPSQRKSSKSANHKLLACQVTGGNLETPSNTVRFSGCQVECFFAARTSRHRRVIWYAQSIKLTHSSGDANRAHHQECGLGRPLDRDRPRVATGWWGKTTYCRPADASCRLSGVVGRPQ